MTYVRERIAPASKERARLRRESAPANVAAQLPGDKFTAAYDWFRAALMYARRRSYLSLAHGDRAQARRLQIIAEAAAAVHAAGCVVDAAVPKHRASRLRREELRGTYYQAPEQVRPGDKALKLTAAHGWLLFGIAQAGWYDRRNRAPEVTGTVARITDELAAKLIEWAEEMDADDYGE
jgi:hypothetical protein